jgi:hypothetical protein
MPPNEPKVTDALSTSLTTKRNKGITGGDVTKDPDPARTNGPDQGTASVSYGMGATVNMGNYEFYRPEVRITLPCKPTVPSIQATFKVAKAWVDAQLNNETDELIAKRDGANPAATPAAGPSTRKK